MLWFFEKHHARLRYEIRRESEGQRFELVITQPDGREEVERFDDPCALLARAEALQQALTAEGWRSPSRPVRAGLGARRGVPAGQRSIAS